jgi:hypothetical protein
MSFIKRCSQFLHRHADIAVILVLFFIFRLMMLMVYPYDYLTVYGDYQHYFNVAAMSDKGYLPFIHYWYEFPPIFPYLNLAIYWLAGATYKNYVFLMGFVLLIAESGNLLLLYRLADYLRGRQRAIQLAWVYTALFVPLFFWRGTFDSLTTCLMLLALYALFVKKRRLLALSLGMGVMVKYIPGVLLPTVWRMRGLKAMLGALAGVGVISTLLLGPFLAISPQFSLASLQAQSRKASWETVWALVDGNPGTGSFGPLSDHLDPAKALNPLGNPSRIPAWVTLAIFGAVGLYVFTRPVKNSVLDPLIFATITLVVFFLWSKGWSPQWQVYLIPLLLLALPLGRALLYIIGLGFVNFLEWPIIYTRGLSALLPLTIITRTLIFVLLAWELYQQLRRPTTPGTTELEGQVQSSP